jgi:hypothetical protein
MSLGKLLLYIFLIGMASAVIVPMMTDTPTVNWTNAKKAKVCKSYIGSIMNRPTSVMTHYKSDENGYVYVKYQGIWFDDSAVTFKYVCTIDDLSITYAQWLIKDESMGFVEAKWSKWKKDLQAKYNYNEESKVLSFTSPKTSEKLHLKL